MDMMTELMDYCQNRFIRTSRYGTLIINADANSINGPLTDVLVGQYIYLAGTRLNDGAHKVTAVSGTVVTVDSELETETTSAYMIDCAVPKSAKNLATDIATWVDKNKGSEGVSSESIGSYSVSFSAEVQRGAWKGAFASSINQYRRSFSDLLVLGVR